MAKQESPRQLCEALIYKRNRRWEKPKLECGIYIYKIHNLFILQTFRY